ncbi:MAG: FAD-binding protein [Desulfobacterales bacterium]|nr:FAD-binding protein [Desulfobacterales bacterium]
MEPRVVSTDVLVIGGGHAALRSALEAARQGVKVTLVDKGRPGRSSIASGDGGGSFGSIKAPVEMGGDPKEPEDAVMRDAVRGGEYLNDQKLGDIFCAEGIDRFRDLVALGVPFGKKPDGTYRVRRNMGESFPRGFGLQKGPDSIFDCLMKELKGLGVDIFPQVMITRLLTKDGRVAGAFGLDKTWGQNLVFQAKATILGTGGMTGLFKHTSAYNPATGDSFALAYGAGAQMRNMEICGFSLIPTPMGISISMGATMPMTAGGARWINADGERIMERYDPERLELADEWKMPYANYKERRDGRGPVYLDLSFMKTPPEGMMEKLKQYIPQIDPMRERVEMSVSIRTSPGGALIDEKARTTVAGLYAAGDASGEAGTRGAGGRTGGFTSAHVFGCRAGLHAAQEARGQATVALDQGQVAGEEKRIASYKKSGGCDPFGAERRVREYASENLNIIRNQQGLERAVGFFSGFAQSEYFRMTAEDLGGLVKALEVANLALTGEMVARSALMRTESRGFHQREDFPARDDANWLKWIMIQKGADGKMALTTRPVPVEEYPLRPDNY